jgi:MYXO-CTERM domain-containing protein
MSNQTLSSDTSMSNRPAWVLPGAMGLAATGVILARRRRANKVAKARKSFSRRMKSVVGR